MTGMEQNTIHSNLYVRLLLGNMCWPYVDTNNNNGKMLKQKFEKA